MTQQLELFDNIPIVHPVKIFLDGDIDAGELAQHATTISYHADGTVTLKFVDEEEDDPSTHHMFCHCEFCEVD